MSAVLASEKWSLLISQDELFLKESFILVLYKLVRSITNEFEWMLEASHSSRTTVLISVSQFGVY